MLSTNKPSTSEESLSRKLTAKISDCFGYTTAHGYGRVAAATESWPRRWFWLLACAAAFGVFIYQLHDLTSQFLSKPLKTRTWIAHQQKLSFPQVTVCNLNKIRQSKMPEDILKDFPQILGGHHNGRNTKTRTNQSLTNNKDRPHANILKEKVQKRLAEYSDSYLQAAGHQLDDMILKCIYDTMECLENIREFWTQFWHPKYGNCYSFNKGRDPGNQPTRLLTSSIPGQVAGLRLELNIEQYEYVSGLTDEAGVRVFIGTQNSMPFPYELGISVPSGFSTGIMLRKVVIGRLDPFANGSCEPKNTLMDSNIFHRYNASYSDMACKISCLATIMYQMCGCVYFTLKYEKMQEVCDISDHSKVACIIKAYHRHSDGSCNNNCREKCREESFKMTVSTADWPSQHYKVMGKLIQVEESCLKKSGYFENGTLQENLRNYGLGNRSKDLNANFLKLKVYYGELNYEVIDEELAYTSARFLSDIGGIMGMWIGISALTCVEVLELFASLCYTILRKIKGERNNVTEEQPHDSPA